MSGKNFDWRTMDNIRVICRFRPSNDNERREEKREAVNVDETAPLFRSSQEVQLVRTQATSDRRPFKAVLDHMFRPSTNQKKVFDLVGRPMVQAVIEGYNATIFAYGQTGSGKTWTMFGPDTRSSQTDLGLVQRCCTYLFDKLDKSADVVEWQVSSQFIQIYKEYISDLLEPGRRRLQIRTNFQTDTPYVEGLTHRGVSEIKDLLIALGTANNNRVVASHKLNSKSSRSHMLLMLSVEQKLRTGEVKRSKLNFGDLAGSEDIRKALGQNPDPERMKEAIAINSTLTALTTAITRLSAGQRPSYRSSSLTHILQDSLGGNSKTTMIVAASPSMHNRPETIRTLRFAMTAKKVINNARVNKELTKAQLQRRIEQLEAENAKLKSRVIELEQTMQSAGMEVVLSAELYETKDDTAQYSDVEISDDEDEDEDTPSQYESGSRSSQSVSPSPSKGKRGSNNSNKNTKKKKKKKKSNKLKNGGANTSNSNQNNSALIGLRADIENMNAKFEAKVGENAVLEQKRMLLTTEIDDVSAQLQATKKLLDQSNGQISTFSQERQALDNRIIELTKSLQQKDKAASKQTQELDREIQRQRNRLQMQLNDKREMQKQVQELNLQNDELVKQNETLEQRLSARKVMPKRALPKNNSKKGSKKNNVNVNNAQTATQNYNNNNNNSNVGGGGGGGGGSGPLLPSNAETEELLRELDAMQLSSTEENMSATDLLLNRFATLEAKDLRLTPEQRMKKTAKQMTELSGDIGDLMSNWLPKNKMSGGRHRNKALVFQVRQLIGHFNVLVNQMKATETSFQNDLRLDIKRRDQEIKQLKKDNRLVHQLQDDLAEKDDQLLTLREEFAHLQSERNQLKLQTEEQQDMIFDVQSQVKYLTTEVDRSRSMVISPHTLSQLDLSSVTNPKASLLGLDLAAINDGNENSDSDEYNSNQNNNHNNNGGGQYNTNVDSASFQPANTLSGNKSGGGRRGTTQTISSSSSSYQSSGGSNSNGPLANRNHNNNNNTGVTTSLSPSNKNRSSSSAHDMRRVSDWRALISTGDQIDCRDESGLWWTAKIVGFDGSRNRLRIRYDGWGDSYDEIIERTNDRLAVYKSKYHREIGGKKIIKDGCMSKEGKMFKTWRKRYFTLDDSGTMTYYQKVGDDTAIGSFSVLNMKRTERQSFGRNKQFGLMLHTDTRVWKFLCEDNQDLSEWIHCINFVKNGQFEEM